MKPFLKWVGGKTQLLKKVLAKFPEEIKGNYYEPFLGGGSVLIGILQDPIIRIHGKIIASDFNKYLIDLYKLIQTNPSDLINKLNEIKAEWVAISIEKNDNSKKCRTKEEGLLTREGYYYWQRHNFNNTDDILLKSALFIFLNKTCFRGVYRENQKAHFNVPYGNPTKLVAIFNEEQINKLSELIKDVEFRHSSYENVLDEITSDDFIYLDPPYYPINETSFTKYNSSDFITNNHTKLFELIKNLNCKWLMSNANVTFVKEFFSDNIIESIICRRQIHSKNPSTVVLEVLINN